MSVFQQPLQRVPEKHRVTRLLKNAQMEGTRHPEEGG